MVVSTPEPGCNAAKQSTGPGGISKVLPRCGNKLHNNSWFES